MNQRNKKYPETLDVNSTALRPALGFLIDEACSDITSHHADSVTELLRAGAPSKGTLNFVCRRYLSYATSATSSLYVIRAINHALSAMTIGQGASANMKEKIIQARIKLGGWRCAQSLLREHLNREVSAREVSWLVDAYLKRNSFQKQESDGLEVLLERYLTCDDFLELIEKFNCLKIEYENDSMIM